jgi:O-antigen biosynthesis protein
MIRREFPGEKWIAPKMRTAKRLVEAGDWRGIVVRILGNALRMLGGFDPAKPRFFDRWREQHPSRDRAELARRLERLEPLPKISVLTPVYNVSEELLVACVESVAAQDYPAWEHVLVDDGSTAPHVRPLLERLAARDTRLRVLFHEKNAGICRATETARLHATGHWLALLDNDDSLPRDALAEMILAVSADPEVEWAYSDFVLQLPDGRFVSPYFKPDFSPARLMNQMYLNHLQLFRRDAVDAVGGFREGFDGSQDHDLALRMYDRVRDRGVAPLHVPKVLYHWRIVPGSTTENSDAKPYAREAGVRAIRSALVRQGLARATDGHDGRYSCSVKVEFGRSPGVYRVDYGLPAVPLVSIIVPFRDAWSVTERCLLSIVADSSYVNVEFLLMDNGSRENATARGLASFCQKHHNARVIRDDSPFNHSELCNRGAREARGEILLMLNNDVEVDSEGWIQRLLMHAQRDDVGAVGCLLLYPNRTIQHAGIVLGIGGVAGHAFKGHGEHHSGYYGSVVVDQDVSAVTGACLMVKKSTFETVCGFDSLEFPTGYNDVDFCLRLRQRGLRNVYTGHARLIHYESLTRKKDPKDEEYRRRMQLRWGPILRDDPFYSPNLSLEWEDFRFGV